MRRLVVLLQPALGLQFGRNADSPGSVPVGGAPSALTGSLPPAQELPTLAGSAAVVAGSTGVVPERVYVHKHKVKEVQAGGAFKNQCLDLVESVVVVYDGDPERIDAILESVCGKAALGKVFEGGDEFYQDSSDVHVIRLSWSPGIALSFSKTKP